MFYRFSVERDNALFSADLDDRPIDSTVFKTNKEDEAIREGIKLRDFNVYICKWNDDNTLADNLYLRINGEQQMQPRWTISRDPPAV